MNNPFEEYCYDDKKELSKEDSTMDELKEEDGVKETDEVKEEDGIKHIILNKGNVERYSSSSISFSEEQRMAIDRYRRGENIFITGPGGVGKSAIIRHIYHDSMERGIHISVCALTGTAANILQCKAKTVHSWAGIGSGIGTIEECIIKVSKNKTARKNWRSTRILIIDEISMMSMKLFNMLNAIGKAIGHCNWKPFGGIQLIFSGDFYQLPPIGSRGDTDTFRFCFESEDWLSIFPYENHIVLTQIFRQQDKKYQSILNQIREGRIKVSTNKVLQSHVGRNMDSVGVLTKIYPKRNKVDYVNNMEMDKLSGRLYEYKMTKQIINIGLLNEKDKKIRSAFNREQMDRELEQLEKNVLCGSIVQLKEGANVMCIVNMRVNESLSLNNGSQGIVIGFTPSEGYPIVRYKNGYVHTMSPYTWTSETIPGVFITQMPLILAWAITIHKSQGLTIKAAEIDAGSDIFESGQIYTALSRVEDLDGLYLTSFDLTKIKINVKVQEFYDNLKKIQR